MTVEQTFVLASEGIDRQWGYTALSRARSGTRLYLAGTHSALGRDHDDLGGRHVSADQAPVARLADDLARDRSQEAALERLLGRDPVPARAPWAVGVRRIWAGICRALVTDASLDRAWRATAIAGLGAQFVVPGFVAVDLAQPVLGAVFGQPRRGIEGPNVDRVPRHVSRRLRGGHPPGGLLFGSVLGNRLTKKLILVLRGTPATIDEELDSVVRGISRSLAQEGWIKIGDTRNLVIKDRRAVGDGTVSLAKRTTVLTAKTTVLTAKDVDG
jgi:hypothetical protein